MGNGSPSHSAPPEKFTFYIYEWMNEWMMFLLTCDKKLTKSQLVSFLSHVNKNIIHSFIHRYKTWTFPVEQNGRKSRYPLLQRCQCTLRKDKPPATLTTRCDSFAQVKIRQRLRSAAHDQLTVPRHRLNTYTVVRYSLSQPAVAVPMTFNAMLHDLRDPSVGTVTFGR